MTSFQAFRFAVLLALSLGFQMASLGADRNQSSADTNAKKGTPHTVDASMGYPGSGGIGIQAEKQPGSFTIPKDSAGTKLKYEFFNPKSGRTLTKLNGRNIYSVTEHRYMEELDENPDFELPPGDYKFVVGGDPGAAGTLSYSTVPSSDAKPPKGTVHTVDASMGYPGNGGIGIQAERQPGSFTIPKDSAGTKLKYEFFNPKSGRTLTKLNGRNIYSVTEHRYMEELDKNPDFELPPGDYKFVVGGDPGATGTLTYTTVPYSGTKPPPKPLTHKTKRPGNSAPPANPILPPDAVADDALNPTPAEPIVEKPGQEVVDDRVPAGEPPQPPPPTVQRDGRCPYCNQYHNGSHTNGSSVTNKSTPPPWTTKRAPPQTTKKVPPWTTRKAPPQIIKKAPPQTTKRVPPQTTKKAPPQTTKKVPPQTTKKVPPQTTKKAPPQTTKKAVPPSLNPNKPNYLGNVIRDGAIQKKADHPR